LADFIIFEQGERFMSKLKDDPVVSVVNSSTVPAAQGGASGLASVLSEVVRAAKTKSARPSKFVISVLSVSDDRSRVKVKLCTGRVIDVPMSILKNVTFLGTASSGDESSGIAAGELDLSTDVGILIQQMAHEITHLSRSLQTAQEGLLRSHATDVSKSLARAEETPATTPKTAKTSVRQGTTGTNRQDSHYGIGWLPSRCGLCGTVLSIHTTVERVQHCKLLFDAIAHDY
jgi:hypothetical protein